MTIKALLISCNVVLLAIFAVWLYLLDELRPRDNGAGVWADAAEACLHSKGVPTTNGWTGNFTGCV
jgi:hypothetical protein